MAMIFNENHKNAFNPTVYSTRIVCIALIYVIASGLIPFNNDPLRTIHRALHQSLQSR